MDGRHLAFFVLFLMLFPQNRAVSADCSIIHDAQLRLKCYDAAATAAKPKDALFSKAAAAVKATLKDPQSARFEGLVHRPGAVCGFVNAKNGYGGYVGRVQFVYVPAQGKAYVSVPMASINIYNVDQAKAAMDAIKAYCGAFIPS